MSENTQSTIEKALAINLDSLSYGTLVEIGAGQEVARWFFQAGGAAGTVAKTMSAYDMKFSDEIYGVSTDRRYVSRARLERMLEREFDLLVSRVEDTRPEGSRFFAFADTVVARGYKKAGECHGWMGIRLQLTPKAPPDEIILHVRLLDDTNVEQQEALGIIGVNLIHAAFTHIDTPEGLMRRLTDNLKLGRIEIDLIEFRGPTLGRIDNRLMALETGQGRIDPGHPVRRERHQRHPGRRPAPPRRVGDARGLPAIAPRPTAPSSTTQKPISSPSTACRSRPSCRLRKSPWGGPKTAPKSIRRTIWHASPTCPRRATMC